MYIFLLPLSFLTILLPFMHVLIYISSDVNQIPTPSSGVKTEVSPGQVFCHFSKCLLLLGSVFSCHFIGHLES